MVDFEEMLAYGKNLIFLHQYDEARKVLESLIQVPECHDEAMLNLVKLDIKEGNYQRARTRLDYAEIKDTASLLFMQGELETQEYNYNLAREIYKRALDCAGDKLGNIYLAMGRLDMLTGELVSARRTFATLANSWEYHRMALFHLVYLDILEGKYLQAENRLLQITEAGMSERNRSYYQEMLSYVRVMGQGKERFQSIVRDANYSLYRAIYPEDEKALLEHIKEHKYNNGKHPYFIGTINLEKLLEDAKELSKSRSPSFYKGKNQYRMKMPYEIGMKDGFPTRDLILVTYPETETVVTMYPSTFSYDFDREGMSTSSDLIEKRENALQKVKEEYQKRYQKKKTN